MPPTWVPSTPEGTSPAWATFKLDIHHNVLWQSSQATRRQAGKKSGYFFKRNPPGDSKYFDNTEKSKHDGGAKGLEDTDYPGGYFETGPTIRDEEDSWYESTQGAPNPPPIRVKD